MYLESVVSARHVVHIVIALIPAHLLLLPFFQLPMLSNTPRGGASLTASGMVAQESGGFADPLAQSSGGFGEVDPWSGTQSPARVQSPPVSSIAAVSAPPSVNGGFASYPNTEALIEDPPDAYIALFRQLDPSPTGQVTLPAVQRLLSSSRLPASTVEQIVNLAGGDKAMLGRPEFYRLLALVAFAQSRPGDDVGLRELEEAVTGLPMPRLVVTPSGSQPVPPRPSMPPNPPSTYSPWDTTPYPESNSAQTLNGGNPDAEAERGYWRRLETVEVDRVQQKEGWFVQKYHIVSDKRSEPMSRRYSDFGWLNHTLLQRYPFRLLPALPPKRVNPDAGFLEMRRKGLQRYLNAVLNHPVIRDDGALNVFMTEPNFEAWRKRVKVSTEEESASKRLNPAQEMAIPSDLEDKLEGLRERLPGLISSYQKMVTLAERELQRRQMSAAEATRFALSLDAVAEDMPAACYHCVPGGKCCDVCQGTGRGLAAVSDGWSRLAEQRERENGKLSEGIESLKTQRDLYIAFRDLFLRHHRLSPDAVEALQDNVVQRQGKIETVRAGQKPGWEAEVARLASGIDEDNTKIVNLLARRVFIRACMWHELGVVLHSRQAAQATLCWRTWVGGEGAAAGAEARVWDRLTDELEHMPLE